MTSNSESLLRSAGGKVRSVLSHVIAMSLQAWPLIVSAAAFYLVCDLDQLRELASISQFSSTSTMRRLGQGVLVLAVFCISFETCMIQDARSKSNKRESSRIGSDPARICAAAIVAVVYPAIIWGLIGFRWPDLIAVALGALYVVLSSKANRNILKVRAAFLIMLLVFIILGIRFTVVSPEIARSVGTIGLAAIGLFLLGEVVTLLFGLIPSVIRGKSAYIWIVPTIVLFAAMYEPVEERISDSHLDLKSKVSALPSASEFTGAWLLQKQGQLKSSTGSPIYVVIAEGGGIRSAYWTASALTALEAESDGYFSRSTIAYSGVSGGSIGIATFLACRSVSDPMQCVEETLGGDLLSPIVARLLFAEPLRLLLRGKYLLPRDDTFIAMLEDQSKAPQARAVWSSGAWVNNADSALFFGSTDLHTGKRITFSNLGSPNYGGRQASSADKQRDITPPIRNVVEQLKAAPKLSFAASASARFPGVSAPVWVDTHLLADGGYRENTGTEEVMPILEELSLLARGRSNLTKIAWIETDLPNGLIGSADSELVDDYVLSQEEVRDLRFRIARAIKLRREIVPLIESRPVRILLLRNNFSVGSSGGGESNIEAALAISGILTARIARTDDAVIGLSEHVLTDNVTRDDFASETSGDSRYADIPESWIEKPELLEGSKHVASHFLTSTFTNDYCHSERSAPLSDLVVLDLGALVGSEMRVPLGWTLSAGTRAAIRQAASKALSENMKAIMGEYDVPPSVLENEDCKSYYEEIESSDVRSVDGS